MKYMLDTNICIYVIREKPAGILRRFRQTNVKDVCISSITLGELEYGVNRSSQPGRNKLALAAFLAPIQVSPFEDMAAQAYGQVRAILEKQGTPIESLDTLIAAHALSLDCTLVTNNEKEFRFIPEMRAWTIIPPTHSEFREGRRSLA